MTQDEYAKAKAADKVEREEQPAVESVTVDHSNGYKFEDFLPALFPLLSPIRHVTTAPTFTPKNYLDSLQFFDDGADRRIYLYFNGTWSYCTLT